MSHAAIKISCFGTLQIALDGRVLPTFATDKAAALLAYLLVEPPPQRRTTLAALFWSEMSENRARANLSQAIYLFRKVIALEGAPSLLLADARTVQLNPAFPLDCDVTGWQAAQHGCATHRPHFANACADCWAALRASCDHYQGEFLAGLSLADCADFELWLLTQRQHFARITCANLQRIAAHQQHQRDWTGALATCQRLIELEPLNEAAQQMLIEAHLNLGDRNAARAAFEQYRHTVQHELNSTPSPAFSQRYHQLETKHPITSYQSPIPQPPIAQSSIPNFVGRSAELARLHQYLAQASAGHGQVIFVTGEAGFGKSALLQAFAQQAQEQSPTVLVAGGNCNAYTGMGDPYLPVREVLALLTGDVETQQSARTIAPDHAARLRRNAPYALRALLELAPDLLGTLIAPARLLARSTGLIDDTALLDQLRKLAERKERERAAPGGTNRPQSDLFEQTTRLLQRLSAGDQSPLLLILDDLQWADMGTVSLLFHLARNLTQQRILIVGAFRPSEVVANATSGARHPLEALTFELQRHFGANDIALEAADGRGFVSALLDRRPNRLDDHFRQRLHEYTHGNALFTVELLGDMMQRGDLRLGEDGLWLAVPTLAWEKLPPRIEGVIGQRIARLAPDLREALTLASIEGESFCAEVVAGVQGVDQRQMVRWLSSELDRQHGLVTLQGIEQNSGRNGGQSITRYRFRHILFQKYLYQRLDAAERTHLHGAVGETLEALYRDLPEASEALAGELARHFAEARSWLKAAEYYLVASRRALRMAVPDTAISQATYGVDLLGKVSTTNESMTIGLGLQICLGIGYTLRNGYGSPDAMSAYERAASVYAEAGNTDELVALLAGLAATYRINARLQQSMEIGRRIVALVEQKRNAKLFTLAYGTLGATLVNMGRLGEARHYLELAVNNHDIDVTSVVAHMQATDPKVLALGYLTYTLIPLGFIDQARACIKQAQALADKLAHPNTQAFSLYFSILAELMRRDIPAALWHLERLRLLAKEQESINFWIQWTDPVVGWIAHEQGDLTQSLTYLRNWLPLRRTQGETHSPLTWQFATLCMALIKAGEIDEGLATIVATLQLAERIDERWWEAELYRLHGELLLRRADASLDPTGEAEKAFQRAIGCAQQQNSKLWELRSTMSLAQLLQKQGRFVEGFTRLSSLHDWFTEGHDGYDLQKAKTLLELLATKS